MNVIVSRSKRFSMGPAVLVTAAFIGPGTVMTASKAGSQYGCVLLWAVGFSVITTIVLQEMAARLGIVTGNGLSQAIKSTFSNRIARWVVLALVLIAIFVGNAAYQTGNILGAASGVKDFVANSAAGDVRGDGVQAEEGRWLDPESKAFQEGVVCCIGALALGVIWIGRFDVLQTLLTLLVAAMSLIFIYAAFKSSPTWSEVAAGFVPRIPTGSEWIVIGLIGTTVVPYNLFLHASAAAERWKIDDADSSSESEYRAAIASSRLDTVVSIVIGGTVTCAILITASVAFHSGDPGSLSHLDPNQGIAVQLEPALGASAKWMFAIGLCAAGLTSAITAPIAAGYAASGCFGWSGKLADWRLKATATIVVVAGVVFAIRLGSSPKETIILAQVANGLLLPIIAVFLLMICNRSDLMKEHKNRKASNLFGVAVILIVSLIAISQIRSVAAKVNQMLNPEQAWVDESVFELVICEVLEKQG